MSCITSLGATYLEAGNWVSWIDEIDIRYLYPPDYICWVTIGPEDFVGDTPGEAEMAGGIFTFSPDPFPSDLDATHELTSKDEEAMYIMSQPSDLDAWLDPPEVILNSLIHREAADSSNIEMTTQLTLPGIYRCEADEEPGQTATRRADVTEAQNYVEAIITEVQALHDRAELDWDLLCRPYEILL